MIFLRVVGDDQQYPEKRVFSIEKVSSFLPKIITCMKYIVYMNCGNEIIFAAMK